ncbi:MAG TPA: cysteine desulfurase family protein [Candidatus Deferrimicrobium sp.]|nr:cysteine desulfurase family protein [Candidatus Deferrimicrobium sp.]
MTVYLDHAASTPLRPEVLAEMLPILEGDGANPSSPHAPGRRARRWLDEAHERLARSIGAEARSIIFTSGGTEAINLAVKGAAWAGKAAGHRILTTAVEHKAVLESCLLLEKYGFDVRKLAVDRYGQLHPDDLTAALTDKTMLVTLQLANNEVGTIQPLAELIGRVRAASPALVHVDAVQGAAHLPIDVETLGADLVSFAAHKVEGPKGVGALWIRRGTTILPQVHGGSQERYRRAGTENVAGAVGMAIAFELATAERSTTVVALASRRDRLRAALLAMESVELTGHPVERLPGSLSVIVRGVPGDDLVMALDLEGVACSTGSACTTGSGEPSHVLAAMGFPPSEARSALRLSLGRRSSDEDVAVAERVLAEVIERLREGQVQLP